MATPEDQARFEQAQSDYTFRRPATAIAESLGIPTTSDDAMRLAAGPRASIAAWLLGQGKSLGGPSNPTILDEAGDGPPPVRVGPPPDHSGSYPTLTTPTVPEAAANAPTARNFPVTGQIPQKTDEFFDPRHSTILNEKVPGNYYPLIADNPPPADSRLRDAWLQSQGYPTQAGLQAKIDSYAAQEGSAGRIYDQGQPAYPFIEPPGAEPPVRAAAPGQYEASKKGLAYDFEQEAASIRAARDAGEISPAMANDMHVALEDRYDGLFATVDRQHGVNPLNGDVHGGAPGHQAPRTHQEMLDSPLFGEEYRKYLAGGGDPLPMVEPPPVVEPAPIAQAELEAKRLGKPGVMVDQEGASRILARDAAEAAAQVPRATRMKSLFKGAAADFMEMAPAAEAVGSALLAAGAMAGLQVQDSTPEGELRNLSNRVLQKPLEMSQVGASADYLRANPARARQLYQEGVLSTDAFLTLMDPALQPQPSLEPMAQAMRRIGG